MSENAPDNLEKIKKDRTRPLVATTLDDGTLVETINRPDTHETIFCVGRANDFRFEPDLVVNGQRFAPYSPSNNLLTNGVVLFPSDSSDYDSEENLVREIQAFIHRYVDVSETFERLSAFYVLFTWVYDSFNELPYLRLRGTPGSGKTRFLLTVGSLCYLPIFASGASTVSPLFRILDAFRGTLVIDEGDFRMSDEKADIIKILNNGNGRGFPVLRSEAAGNSKEYNPRAYSVFGPKLVATRKHFQDRALESRCLTEEMGHRSLRKDVPINLPPQYVDEARLLRNKLLRFRMRNAGRIEAASEFIDHSIEPRLNQMFVPLLSIVSDPTTRADIQTLARQYNRELAADRGMETEAQVLEVIRDLLGSGKNLGIKEITSWFQDRFSDGYERKITTKWIGFVVRKRLQLRTRKSHGVFVVEVERDRLARLYDRYGVETEEATRPGGDVGDLGDFGAEPSAPGGAE